MTIRDRRQYFIDNSYVNENTGCWVWMKYRDAYGYGMATREDTGNSGLAHRESYKAYHGTIPEGMVVMHDCDNPSCVNPNHLSLGTQKSNMEDMKRKGRSPDRKGEKGTTAKLTLKDVEFIKGLEDFRGITVYLANIFGVSKTTICDIRKGRTWK